MRICQCLFLVVPGLLQSCLTSATPVGPLQVQIESGTRTTSAGDTIAYDLFVPVASEQPPQPPWPAVVLNHGFARSKETQYNNALYMAQRGIVVLTPNQVSLLTGEQGQLRNIANTVDHVQWLNDRTADPSDPLAGQIDSNRIGLAGHSAGGRDLFRGGDRSAEHWQNPGRTGAAGRGAVEPHPRPRGRVGAATDEQSAIRAVLL
jgi:predicted dienelactone hydrolase